MRTPREDVLPRAERLRVVALDVTSPESIAAALGQCGAIDVLVNNAGIGVVGAFEATPMRTVREVFETLCCILATGSSDERAQCS
jgi:NAD(P)-dependent dehydrogenase (short-subunit alcohol dehydrogenase family)